MPIIETNTVNKLVCNRCGHEWFPRSQKLPKVCAKCRSPYWNKPRVKGIKAITEKLI